MTALEVQTAHLKHWVNAGLGGDRRGVTSVTRTMVRHVKRPAEPRH